MSLFGGEENLESKNRVFPHKLVLVLVLITGIVLGGALTHYVIEPFLTNGIDAKLSECKSSLSLVNQEIDACLRELETPQNSDS